MKGQWKFYQEEKKRKAKQNERNHANDNSIPSPPGGHKYGMFLNLLHGDCLDYLATIPDGSVSLIIFDPPYATLGYKWDKHLDHAAVIAEFERILTPLGTVVAFGSDGFSFHLQQAFKTYATAIRYRYSAIWLKTASSSFPHAKNRPLKVHEDIMIFSKGLMGHPGTGSGKTVKRMTYNPQGLVELPIKKTRSGKGTTTYLGKPRNGKDSVQTHANFPTTVYRYEREKMANDPHRHPTKKPVALIEELIRTYSNPGDCVLDPTMGSGTTAVACQNIGDRSCIGIERDPGFFAIAQERCGVTKQVAGAGKPIKIDLDPIKYHHKPFDGFRWAA